MKKAKLVDKSYLKLENSSPKSQIEKSICTLSYWNEECEKDIEEKNFPIKETSENGENFLKYKFPEGKFMESIHK